MFHREQNVDARTFAQAEDRLRDLIHCVFLYFLSAVHAERTANAGVEQAEIVVNLSGGGDGGAGIARGIFLPDGNGRGNAVNQVNVRLFNPLQKLAGIG